MARRRYISTAISTDSAVAKLGKDYGEFAALLYTWMIPHAEDDGCIKADIESLILMVIPGFRWRTEKDVEEALNGMVSMGLIQWDKENNVISFPESFFKYQTYIGNDRRSGTKNKQKKISNEKRTAEATQSAAREHDTQNDPAKQNETPQNAVSFSVLSSSSSSVIPYGADEKNPPPEETAGEEIKIDDIPLEDVPAPMRETVEFFLLKTKRKTITPGELSAIRALEEIHAPARVSKEITAQMGKFVKRGRDPAELTLEYVYEVLKHQKSGSLARKPDSQENQPEPPWQYAVTYEALAGLWDKHMPDAGFMPAPEPIRKWKQLLGERIAENPSQRDSLSWWESRLREIDDSDIASARQPVNADGTLWRLELSTLLASEEKLQKLVTGRYRNREKIRDGPQFKPYEGPEDDYDPGVWGQEGGLGT